MSPAMYATLEALEDGIQALRGLSPEYHDKMLHRVPDVPSVDRAAWLVDRLAAKTILHIGCVGPLHEALLKVCTRAYGIDQEYARYRDYFRLDVETMRSPLPRCDGVEVVLLGEVLEHLVSPGALLQKVREGYPGCEVVITVPNCFSTAGQQWLARGFENVNRDHCQWYSWKTMSVLLEKCAYQVQEWYWTGGKPLTAEGLLFVCR